MALEFVIGPSRVQPNFSTSSALAVKFSASFFTLLERLEKKRVLVTMLSHLKFNIMLCAALWKNT